MGFLLTSRIKYIIPITVGASLSLYLSNRFLSNKVCNDTTKALKGFGRWQKFRITNIDQLSPNARKFTFELHDKNSVLGLEPASFVLTNVSSKWGPWNLRPYTPISSVNEKGTFEIDVKHMPHGKTSGKFFELKKGDFVPFMGPILKYKWQPNKFDEVVLLCGGSGITPMFQLIRSIADNPVDKTKIQLYYANKTKSDILLRQELEKIKDEYPDQLKLNFYVEKGDVENEKDVSTGYIPKNELEKFAGRDNLMIFLCGSDGFIECYGGAKGLLGRQRGVGGILGDLGFHSNQVFKF